MPLPRFVLPTLILLGLSGCSAQAPDTSPNEAVPGEVVADVTAVSVSGGPGAYQLSVTIRSPDTGCEQYADWWEVVAEDGTLIYRRILAHSHVNEQPFTRSGGPVPIGADSLVVVRAHMVPTGYGGQVMRGTPAAGFAPAARTADFAAPLEDASPQPEGCAF